MAEQLCVLMITLDDYKALAHEKGLHPNLLKKMLADIKPIQGTLSNNMKLRLANAKASEVQNADLCRKNRRAGRAEKVVNRPPTLELAVADLSFFVRLGRLL
jgi:hypothetical protein